MKLITLFSFFLLVSFTTAARAQDVRTVYASSVTRLNSNLVWGGGFDNTAALQNVLDTAHPGAPLRLVVDGAARVRTLRVRSDTEIVGANGGGFFLTSRTNGPVLCNYDLNNSDPAAITDRNITLRNLRINGNAAGQTHTETGSGADADGGAFVVGLKFFGVAGLNLENVHVYNSKKFGVWLANVHQVRTRGVVVEFPDFYLNNHDGIHVNGNSSDLVFRDTRLVRNTDDGIALNARDDHFWSGHANGPITDVLVDGLVGDEAFFGLRFLSATERIDRVTVRNVSGEWHEYVAHFDSRNYAHGPFPASGADGNIGSVTFDGVHIKTFDIGDYAHPTFEAFRIGASVERLDITNFRQDGGWYGDYRPVVRVGAGGTAGAQMIGAGWVGSLAFDGSVYDPPGTAAWGPQARSRFVVEGRVARMSVRIRHDRAPDVARNFGAVEISGWVGTLAVSGEVARQGYAVALNGGRLDALTLAGLADSETAGLSFYVAPGAVAPLSVAYGTERYPLDDPRAFARQQYLDFFGREPDAQGWDYWTRAVTSCGTDRLCGELRRLHTSAAFFLSIEFQETGFYAIRVQRAAFGRRSAEASRLTLAAFLPDARALGDGVVVGAGEWQQRLEANKRAYAERVVASPEFAARFPETMSGAEFVAALYRSAGVSPSLGEFDAAISAFNRTGRADALRRAAESGSVTTAEINPAFVLMEYFGYLRRDPDEAGYQFWLGKLEEFRGDFVRAEMVKAFLSSDEYVRRFP